MSEKILTFLERVEMNLPVQSQEVFDQSVGGVIRQGRQAGEKDPAGYIRCLYRDPEGGACAYGQCIPDSMYDKGMEQHNADELNSKGWVPESLKRHLPLLIELQNAHDNEHRTYPGQWLRGFEARVKDIAHEFGLVWKF
jgi:hypothetical protein